MNVEQRGTQIIVTGNTYAYRQDLKRLGLKWDWTNKYWHTDNLGALEPLQHLASTGKIMETRISFTQHHGANPTAATREQKPTRVRQQQRQQHEQPTGVRVHYEDDDDEDEPPTPPRQGLPRQRSPPRQLYRQAPAPLYRQRPPPPRDEEVFVNQQAALQVEVCYDDDEIWL